MDDNYSHKKRSTLGFGAERTSPHSPERHSLVSKLKEIEFELKKFLRDSNRRFFLRSVQESRQSNSPEEVQVDEEASDKILEIEQHYDGKRRPFYVKRNQIIKTIPDFWLTAFVNHPALGDLLTYEDQKIFKYLESLDVKYLNPNDVKSGYVITFEFKPNPYFENTKLIKIVAFDDKGNLKIMVININWKEGMKGSSSNGVDHGEKGNKRPTEEEEESSSFFDWFSQTHEEDGTEITCDLVAEIIKEDLWPNPLQYYSNVAAAEESCSEDEE